MRNPISTFVLGLALACGSSGLASAQELWRKGVLGIQVGQAQNECITGEGNRYRGQGTVQFSQKPGRYAGSNEVWCTLTRTAQSRPPSSVLPAGSSAAAITVQSRRVVNGQEQVLVNGQWGTLVAQGGGNFSFVPLVAQGGGNIVSTGSGNLIQGGGANMRPR